ncbi:MAG: hypothetical protein U1E71_09655 [Ramlibacter sp.]|jgi:hypothetical protein
MESSETPEPGLSPDAQAPALRLSPALARVPVPRDSHTGGPAAPSAPRQPDPPPALISSAQSAIASQVEALRQTSSSTGMLPLTVSLGALAAVASLGWLIERRRTRREQDSVLWADVQPAASSIVTKVNTLDDILPDSPNPAESARAIYVTAIGETNSRREATLIDLHQLQQKLERRRKRGDHVAAVLLLQQHLVDFRYTSPWVFLELRELYRQLDLEHEWEVARDAFRARFGQNAPLWATPSTADAQLLDDEHLCAGIAGQWPYRPARMWILRWLLGEHEMRVRAMGPPLLPLGVYRDLMLLDDMLDDVMLAVPVPQTADEPADTLAQDSLLSPT